MNIHDIFLKLTPKQRRTLANLASTSLEHAAFLDRGKAHDLFFRYYTNMGGCDCDVCELVTLMRVHLREFNG